MKQVLTLAVFVFVFAASFHPSIDLDLGWHLRYGQYFFATGQVLKDNILSFVWPGFAWVQASWGYDLIVYPLFINFGFLGLSLTAALITLLIFYLITPPLKHRSPANLFLLSVIFLTQTAPLYGTGLRAQTLSALMFTLVLLLTTKLLSPSRHSPMLYALCSMLFLLWANLHGGFALGLILVTLIWILSGLLKTASSPNWLLFGLTLLISWLVPLLNPWGPKLYQETFAHSRNLNLTVISEWQPLDLTSLEGAVTLLCLAIVLIVAFKLPRRTTHLPYLITLLFVAYLSFTALRFIIIFGIMVTYFLARHLPKKLPAPYSLLTSLTLITLVIFDMFVSHKYFIPPHPRLLSFSWADYCQLMKSDTDLQAKDCSEAITQIMLADPPPAGGFHPYNYGGYLSWRVPQVKTFVDGRMAAWEDHGLTPPVVEGDEVFLDPTPLTWHKFDSQYHFQWAIIPTQTPIVAYLDNLVTLNLWTRPYQDKFYSYYVKTP